MSGLFNVLDTSASIVSVPTSPPDCCSCKYPDTNAWPILAVSVNGWVFAGVAPEFKELFSARLPTPAPTRTFCQSLSAMDVVVLPGGADTVGEEYATLAGITLEYWSTAKAPPTIIIAAIIAHTIFLLGYFTKGLPSAKIAYKYQANCSKYNSLFGLSLCGKGL